MQEELVNQLSTSKSFSHFLRCYFIRISDMIRQVHPSKLNPTIKG